MSNSVYLDEMAHYEPSHLDLRCLQKPIIIACGNERVKSILLVPTPHPRFIYCKIYKKKKKKKKEKKKKRMIDPYTEASKHIQ